ncbi:MAG: hypothetical protein JWQ23_617 [Herminiimonas sp.]|nr:hypothetical protein [Herminiimonas sp.]
MEQSAVLVSPGRGSNGGVAPVVLPRPAAGGMPRPAAPTFVGTRKEFKSLIRAYEDIGRDLGIFKKFKVTDAKEAQAHVKTIVKTLEATAKDFKRDYELAHVSACEAEKIANALVTVLEKMRATHGLPVSCIRLIQECGSRAADSLDIVSSIAYVTHFDQNNVELPVRDHLPDTPPPVLWTGIPDRLEGMHDTFVSEVNEKQAPQAPAFAAAVHLTPRCTSTVEQPARADSPRALRLRRRRNVSSAPILSPKNQTAHQREALMLRMVQLNSEILALVAQMKAFRNDEQTISCCDLLLELSNAINDKAQNAIIADPHRNANEALALIFNSFNGIMGFFKRLTLAPANEQMPDDLSAACTRIRALISGSDAPQDPPISPTPLSPTRNAVSPRPRPRLQARGDATHSIRHEKQQSVEDEHGALIDMLDELDELDGLMNVPIEMTEKVVRAEASPGRKRPPDHALDDQGRAKSRRSEWKQSPGAQPQTSIEPTWRAGALDSPGTAARKQSRISLAAASRRARLNVPPLDSRPPAAATSLPVQAATFSKKPALPPVPFTTENRSKTAEKFKGHEEKN